MKNSFYFDHDYNARNDQRVLELRAEFGWEGYGIFFAILESLCEAKGKIKREALGGLSLGFSHPKDRLILLIDYCIKIGLLYEDKDGFYSNRIIEHLEFRQKLSASGSKGGRGNKKPPFSLPLAPLEAVKESKGEERKGKKSKVFIAPTLNDVKEYFCEKGYSEQSAIKAFNFYDSANWHDSKNNPVKNWKQKMNGVWFTDENKSKEILKPSDVPQKKWYATHELYLIMLGKYNKKNNTNHLAENEY